MNNFAGGRTMRLELNSEGRLIIRDVTPETLEYIKRTRPHNQAYWYFGEKLYDGSLYLDGSGDGELLGYIKKLFTDYGMEIGATAKILLNNWERIEYLRDTIETKNKKIDSLYSEINGLKRIFLKGCASCKRFEAVRDGDDWFGYCVQTDCRTKLDASPLSFDYGGYGKNGVYYMSQKWYPHNGCEYLKIKER